MKKISLLILLVSTMINAQQSNPDYDKLWSKVSAFEKENLPKSANDVITDIYSFAKNEKNTPQLIKALLYQSKYSLTLEEDAQLHIIHHIEKEITTADFPAKNILENILANLYWQYFQQNRWQFYNRTNTSEKVDETDFRTWDLHTIFEEIHLHFQKSLENGLLAQQTPIEEIDLLLHKHTQKLILQPTLYDFLAQNALDFYKTGESNLAQPSTKFEIDKPGYLGDTEDFLREDLLESSDSLSQKRQALIIFRSLTRLHQLNNNLEPLIDINLQRLDFVKQNAVFSTKNEQYYTSLLKLKEAYAKNSYSTEIDYKIALELQRMAGEYQPLINEKNQFKLEEAIEVCQIAIERHPKSNGALKCQNLIAQIKNPYSNISNESYIEPQKESRLLVNYKNINKLFFRIYAVNKNSIKEIQHTYNIKKKLNYIKRMKEVVTFEKALKNENDYQQHATELILPQLPQGQFLILASDKADFTDESSFSYSYIQATNIVLIENNANNTYQYQVVNRFTGKPLKGAVVSFSNKGGNNRYNKLITLSLRTDEKGFVHYTPKDHHSQIRIQVKHNEDEGSFQYYRMYKHGNQESSKIYQNNTIFLFTDRSIYRPGQIVYFKGIAVAQQDKKSNVIPNRKVEVVLTDANYQEVKKINLRTNEYGSFSGEFILPSTGLTGYFEINANSYGSKSAFRKITGTPRPFKMQGSIGFSVEEYKRPKFSAHFNKITKTFTLNDSVQVIGTAMAYAGSSISDAKVVYRVTRNVQYPNWWYWYRPYGFESQAQEITHGETTTNAKGEFEINFLAQPDKSVDKKDLPVFNYEIYADITDINGETRSATTLVNVGYHALTANMSIPNRMDKNKKEQKITINTKNLNGEFIPAKGEIKVYKLNAPKNVYRPRPWQAPDYNSITGDEFETLFPHDAYSNIKESSQWDKGDLLFTGSFDTSKEKELAIKKLKKWDSGKYIAVLASKDRFGQKVSDQQLFEVYSDTDKKVADNQLFTVSLDKEKYKIGETAQLKIGSASNDITFTICIEKNHKIVSTELIHLSNEIKTISIPITKESLGGFGLTFHFVNYNSFDNGERLISVPYPKTELSIETQTFRDKLQPGQEETWRFTVKGPKGDRAIAEILSSMYDASLDQFEYHQWSFNPIYNRYYYISSNFGAGNSFGNHAFTTYHQYANQIDIIGISNPSFNWFGFHFGNQYYGRRKFKKGAVRSFNSPDLPKELGEGGMRKQENQGGYFDLAMAPMEEDMEALESTIISNGFLAPAGGKNNNQKDKETGASTDFSSVKIRTNFNETAFFFPHLTTDEEGNVSFSFTTPESLTKWKVQLLAHTKDLNTTVKTLETVTQKDLMLLPNPPRFLREGDKIVLSTKISNISDQDLTGNVALQLFDAITNNPIDTKLGNTTSIKEFSVPSKGNTSSSWTLSIPDDVQAVLYKIVAKAGDFSDGEQNVLPVLSNRMLVTESLPMWIRSNQTKTFTLDKLKNNTSTTLKNHKLTLEVTSNPAWYAVQALPYLMEYPYECAEQTFSRYYANTLASHIANSNPRIQQVFNQWKNTDALLSNLEKNQELKSLIIQETPWLRDAQSETEQKKRIALLFDLHKMKAEQAKALKKLEQMQMSGGGFPWFKGSRHPNRYITQHIVAGMGHLDKLGAGSSSFQQAQDKQVEKNVSSSAVENQMLIDAISYLDNEVLNDYQNLLKKARIIREKENDKAKGKKLEREFLAFNHTSHFQVHYLYTRSFFEHINIPNKVKEAVAYYTNQSYTYWQDYNLYTKGMIALISFRNKNVVSKKIMASLQENAITSEELGMYWKANTNSYFWYQAPIETQALLIEAFAEAGPNFQTEAKNLVDVDNLKVWLLKNKQTNRWKTTKATTEAVYALLLQGTNWLETTEFVDITIGKTKINPLALEDAKVEAGTGYYKTSWNGTEITPKMADVSISKNGKGIAWGALYWQYFENLDKITAAKTPLQLSKKLFLKTNESRGEVLTAITPDTKLQLGDLVRVRIELKVDRAMEFIHMKDMRASGFEPVNVLSKYKWQDGLGYYESTKDASTNFFIDYLPKGVYVFEYDLRVNNAGDFSNGITSIQSMYAPEFSSHSEGVRVKIDQ